MGSYIPDQSGINSLGGFAYQIRLFVYYMLSMEENMSIGFEVIDDISIKTLCTFLCTYVLFLYPRACFLFVWS